MQKNEFPEEILKQILENQQYIDYNWEDTKSDKDLDLNRKILLSFGFEKYLYYIYHQIAFQQLFDLPNIIIDTIIDKIPIEGFNLYFKLSDTRIERYAPYLTGKLIILNDSLTPALLRKYKDKLDTSRYYQKIKYIDEKQFEKLLKYKKTDILHNPTIIPFVEKRRTLTALEEYELSMNPELTKEVILTNTISFDTFLTNPLLSNEIIESLLAEREDDRAFILRTILAHHIQTDDFMKMFGKYYKKYPLTFFENPCSKINQSNINFLMAEYDMLYQISHEEIINAYIKNPLCKINLLYMLKEGSEGEYDEGVELPEQFTIKSSAYTFENYKDTYLQYASITYETRKVVELYGLKVSDQDEKYLF